MSWAATAYVKQLFVAPNGGKITRSEKGLLLILSDYYNDETGEAWPSIGELAKHALLSERQAQRLLHVLEVKGVLVIMQRHHRNGGQSSNGYRFPVLTPGDTMSPPPVTLCHPPGDIAMSPPGDTMSPPLSLNLVKEPLPEQRSPVSLRETPPVLAPTGLVEMYNALTPLDHPKVSKLTPARHKKAARLLRTFPDRGFWESVFQEVGQSPLLLGLKPTPAHPNFKGDFDWILATGKDGTENCVKVAEGKYRESFGEQALLQVGTKGLHNMQVIDALLRKETSGHAGS